MKIELEKNLLDGFEEFCAGRRETIEGSGGAPSEAVYNFVREGLVQSSLEAFSAKAQKPELTTVRRAVDDCDVRFSTQVVEFFAKYGDWQDAARIATLSGKMKYYKLPIGGDGIVGEGRTIILKEGDRSYNRAGEIHMGEFLEDSWVVEYKFSDKDAWTQADYEPYRQMVRESAE